MRRQAETMFMKCIKSVPVCLHSTVCCRYCNILRYHTYFLESWILREIETLLSAVARTIGTPKWVNLSASAPQSSFGGTNWNLLYPFSVSVAGCLGRISSILVVFSNLAHPETFFTIITVTCILDYIQTNLF